MQKMEKGKGLATLRNLVTAEPNSAGAHFNLGLLSMRKGQPTDREAAATEFREALRLDDSMNGARIALGRVLNSLGKYSEAIPALVEYTRRAPKDAQGFNVLGKANQGLEKPEAAMGAFQRAAALDPKDATIRFDLGTLLARTGQTDAGIRELEAAERINPSDIETHKQLALLLEKAGNKSPRWLPANRAGRWTLRIHSAATTPTSTNTANTSTSSAYQPWCPSHGSVARLSTTPISAIRIVGNSTRKPQKMKA